MNLWFKLVKIENLILFVFSMAYFIFCSYLMIELPHLTWFDQMPLIPKLYNGTLSFIDLFTVYGEHGLFGNNILFILNTIFFDMTTMFDVYLNNINVFIIGLISIISLKNLNESFEKKLFYYFAFFSLNLFFFSFIQYSSGAMETQVRLGILFFVITVFMTDKILLNKVNLKYLTFTLISIVFSINIFGTLYSFAGIPVVFFILLFYLKNKTLRKEHFVIFITYFVCIFLYFIQYDLLGKGHFNSNEISGGMLEILDNPIAIIKSIFAYAGSSLLGYAVYADKKISNNAYLFIGFITSIIYSWAILKFFYSKIYHKTFIPILFIGYSFFVFILVMIGRDYHWEWFINNWYTVHTKLALIGVSLILFYDYKISNKINRIINVLCLLFLFFGSFYGNFRELKRVPYEREYYLEKQPYLFVNRVQDLPLNSNGETPLLHSLNKTIESINILKKYGLSVYKYYKPYEKMQKILGNYIPGDRLENCQIIKGFFTDKWIQGVSEFKIMSGNNGRIKIKGYYPKNITGNEKILIYMNQKLNTEYILKENRFEIEIKVDSNSIIDLKLENNFEFQAELPDERRLSFILDDLLGE